MSVKCREAGIFFAIALGVLFSGFLKEAWAAPEEYFLREVTEIAAMEKDYFRKKVNKDLQGVYDYQHPDFKIHVSIEEFQYFDGRVVYNYRDGAAHHLSGGLTPSFTYIKNNPVKKDALGFEHKRNFRWLASPFISIQNYFLKKISISDDGNYAMVQMDLKGKEKINPALARGSFEFDIKVPYVDYWEKVDGKWKIALLADAGSISGGTRVQYFIPNSNAAWGKLKFISFIPKLPAGAKVN